jgi:hypothetical protein
MCAALYPPPRPNFVVPKPNAAALFRLENKESFHVIQDDDTTKIVIRTVLHE